MNNVAFGGTVRVPSPVAISGHGGGLGKGPAGRGAMIEQQFSYYETLGGGAGAGPLHAGASAVHTHMTNTMNTPIEALEAQLPVRVVCYAVRRHSGGRGRHRGGDGIIRQLEFLAPAQLTLLTERRSTSPFGVAGGAPGLRGVNELTRRGRRTKRLAAKISIPVHPGDRVRLLTPGGGGWGRPARRKRK